MWRRTLVLLLLTSSIPLAAIKPDILRSVAAIPPHITGRFREPIGFQQSAFGQFYVFDRRAHTVYGIDEQLESVWQIVTIGAESGKIIDPTAFSVAADGSFAVADAPNNRERIQIFSPVGFRTAGFMLPGRALPRVVHENFVLSGIGSLQYTGQSILMSQPETGALVTEYALDGRTIRTFGNLRSTGHENDRQVHLALNSGVPLVDPRGGFLFVFQAGEPAFQKFDKNGTLVFERRIQGREIDGFVGNLPTTWPRRKTEGGEQALVQPTVRSAAIDSAGSLWVAFMVPYVYVFDADGDKVRTVQFQAAGTLAPSSMFFGKNGRLLTTPGLFEFAP
ncbi:MAG TPA: hypothetical protein VGJ29_04230 [Vicinamibacterales bacterium]|jgi:hypothetical protein